MKQYLDLLQDILDNGELREDRTGTGTLSVFGRQVRYDLRKGFPLLTTKKMSFKSVASELLWFLEGSSDERRLAEILYNKPREELFDKKTIWTENVLDPLWVTSEYCNSISDCGRNYSKQWRSWINKDGKVIDQIKNIIYTIKTQPLSRRHIVVAYNPGEVNQTCLRPCHVMFQFYVSNHYELSCHVTLRSNDLPLGHPYNVSSYALLTHMIAQVCALKVGELVMSISDAHIYKNQIEGCVEQLQRIPTGLPELQLNPIVMDIDDFTLDDMKIINYITQDPIKFPFSL